MFPMICHDRQLALATIFASVFRDVLDSSKQLSCSARKIKRHDLSYNRYSTKISFFFGYFQL